ncbi:MAG: GAF domain-containing protein [Anaerolineales bacterium]|nr:GAF domain-containing protein [Anaerolineales bacterium]
MDEGPVSAGFFHALFEDAPLGKLVLDLGLHIVKGNGQIAILLKRKKTEILGLPLTALIEPDDLQTHAAWLESLRDPESLPEPASLRLRHEAGPLWCLLRPARIVSQESDAPVILLIVEDISQSRDESRQWQQERRHLQLLNELLLKGLVQDIRPAETAQEALSLIINNLSVLRGEMFILRQQKLSVLALAGYVESDLTKRQTQVEQRFQQAAVQHVLESGKGLTVPDVNCQDYWLPIPDLDDEICSVAMLPLMANKRIIGVMSLLSDEANYFTEERLPWLTAVAATVATSLNNANLIFQIRRGRERLQQLTGRIVRAQEEERRRVSRALHDETGQAMITLQLCLDGIRSELADENPLQEKLAEANRLLVETSAMLGRMAHSLCPPELASLGLNAALESLCEEYARHVPYAISYIGSSQVEDLPEDLGISFYRCLQESLTNITKHSQATQVQVTLRASEDEIILTITDNGHGFPLVQLLEEEVNSVTLGILGMKERFESHKGHVDIQSSPDGTTLIAQAPRPNTDA